MLNNKEAIEKAIIDNPHLTRGEIETNRFWIRIETDGSNLPEFTKNQKFRIHDINWDKPYYHSYDWSELNAKFKAGTVTHYKPITPELPPVY